MKVKQFYAPYEKWEDYLNGFYNTTIENYLNENELIDKSYNLLCNPKKFDEKCNIVLNRWKISSMVNLTNNEINHKAWLGQAACCYNHNAPNYITRISWSKMTYNEQKIANKIAQNNINKYLIKISNYEYSQKTIEF